MKKNLNSAGTSQIETGCGLMSRLKLKLTGEIIS